MKTIVRPITENELAASADIVRRSFQTVADAFGLTRENAPTNGAFMTDTKLLEEYQQDKFVLFGLFEGARQAGFVELERNTPELFYLEKLAVLPESRHHGYGRLLMDHAVHYAKQSGAKRLSIGVIYENTQLVKWYRSYGFAQTGLKEFPHLPFTVCFMELII